MLAGISGTRLALSAVSWSKFIDVEVLISNTFAAMCNKRLDSTLCNENEGALFCKTCYGRKLGPKGYGFGGAGSVPALMAAGEGQFDEPRSL